MSRPARILRKRFVVFCEGDTEYNYIEHMRCNQGVEIALQPVNMGGGGYSGFLERIKSSANNNCLAKFIIVDADRARDDAGERNKLRELVEFCVIQNQRKVIPHFLVLNGSDFEYIACLHDPNYKGQNTESYIKERFGCSSISYFKKNIKVYELLNSAGRSYREMLNRTKQGNRILYHVYVINRETFDINISEVRYFKENLGVKGSNIFEFFEVIDW